MGRATAPSGTRELDETAVERAASAMWSERSELYEHDGQTLFVDVVAPPPRLIIFGAVDFAAQLAAAAKLAGWRAFVVDPRKRFATADRFPEAERVIAAWPDKALDELGGIDRATSIAVLTHDPKLDDAVLKIALRSDAQYIGAMGSRRAQEKRRERLLAEGLTDEELGRLAAPIGSTSAPSRRRRPRFDHGRDHGRPPGTRGRAAEDRQGPNPRRGLRSRGGAGRVMDIFAVFTPLLGHVAGLPVEETLPACSPSARSARASRPSGFGAGFRWRSTGEKGAGRRSRPG